MIGARGDHESAVTIASFRAQSASALHLNMKVHNASKESFFVFELDTYRAARPVNTSYPTL